ncbi:THO complex subunit 7A [Camellia lanceoleosa]|uniref:THO complex subunit 7A n=1 Tax=Camellia lanceoleosa TaxID=1840588 RepID=A0ACC0F7H3_9ERIC|nr:THO complex subunit 7A [Camellia lanceoleosa]
MLVKGRKVAGREETMAAHYAFGPFEDDIIIKHRFLIRTTTIMENYSDCERLAKTFLQELTLFELLLLKSKAVIDANLREKENFNELEDEINMQIL